MTGIILPAVGLAALGFLAYRAARVWADAGRRRFDPPHQLAWALVGAVAPSRYWWGARIDALARQERSALLARETEALGLSCADSLRCPICGDEVPNAWALASERRPTVAPGPVECPRCDFRLDACRHCARFLPGDPRAPQQFALGTGDLTFGRCRQYTATQPVEQVCQPQIARQLKARGLEHIRAPLPIVDSLLPPDFCATFRPDQKRLKAGGVRWPDARRVALLGLLAPLPPQEARSSEALPWGDEQWLV